MTSSPELAVAARGDGMPPALSSMWRALQRGYQAEPLLLVVAFALSLLAALPDALLALWLLGQTIAAGQIVGMVVVFIAMGAHSRYRAVRERDEVMQ